MREAKFAGSFYEKSPSKIMKQIEECFLDQRGPGALPSEKTNNKLKAVIAPHAGYLYSGPCAAWSYQAIAESDFPDLFILIGPSHHFGESGFSMETVETPLGLVRVKQDFARKLAEKGSIKQNEKIHDPEHSLEVQLPFLQFIYQKKIEKIKILPILLSYDANLKRIALDIKETLIETGYNPKFIISSDFTHYGPNFNYLPFTKDVKQNIYDLDGKAIDLIKKQDAEGFKKFVDEKMITICGHKPINLLLHTIKAEKVLLEQYYTSGDLTEDYKNSVSYASIIFR